MEEILVAVQDTPAKEIRQVPYQHCAWVWKWVLTYCRHIISTDTVVFVPGLRFVYGVEHIFSVVAHQAPVVLVEYEPDFIP